MVKHQVLHPEIKLPGLRGAFLFDENTIDAFQKGDGNDDQAA